MREHPRPGVYTRPASVQDLDRNVRSYKHAVRHALRPNSVYSFDAAIKRQKAVGALRVFSFSFPADILTFKDTSSTHTKRYVANIYT